MNTSDENIVLRGTERFLFRESAVPANSPAESSTLLFPLIKKCDVDLRINLCACRALRWHDHFSKDVLPRWLHPR